MEDNSWIPIEGLSKQKRSNIGTYFSKKRADHRNAILKDWAKRLEPEIEPKIPIDYICPFDKDKCVYCLSNNIGPTGDEFRPSTQRGRQNKVNCLPCCGNCNSSKQDKCGTKLIKWIKEENPSAKREPISIEQQNKIINWYQQNEKYLLIPTDIVDPITKTTYEERLEKLDTDLNRYYEEFR